MFPSPAVTRHVLTAGLVSLALACGKDLPTPPPPGPPPPPPPSRPTLPTTYRPSGHMAAGDVAVHLFEWRWVNIAAECENVLGPAGVKAVQISPPQEHSITPSHDWSERYQPVSYSVAHSRSGGQPGLLDHGSLPVQMDAEMIERGATRISGPHREWGS